ncbi:putative two-component membrane permease complex subunit [Austwickia sp. TVS 96-490-7B]|uniref:permease n=1 Tax=Austwickia sp. TVS 96-490-7B TaxID=2830843 RepID=UPI001C581392|nr:permease [Austwickia sp. TVS 96-490-7B]MBW3084536.1 putative two-component membrane permease complex subunit [Austwickia sp. TVS 96-490-7B]
MPDTQHVPAADAAQESPEGPSVLGVGVAAVAMAVLLLVGTLGRSTWGSLLAEHAIAATWVAVFVAIALQAFPFLVLGVAVSAVVAVLIPASALRRILPQRGVAAVPVAGLAGALLPGCECASVPIAGSLVARGVPASAALTFLLAAPAINPVVLVSTAVAFGGDVKVVAARFTASLITSVVMGYWWLARGRDDLIKLPHRHSAEGPKLQQFTSAVTHDLLHAGGYLILGGAIAATINVLVPRTVLDTLAGNIFVAVLTLAVFAVIVAVCSEADAFIAASMVAFPLPARLAFMVVGPALDVKLFAMQAGTFGRAFAVRFAPMTFVVAVASALIVGEVLL